MEWTPNSWPRRYSSCIILKSQKIFEVIEADLSHAVVVVSVRHKKSCLDVAAIGILQLATKEPVQLPVVVVVDCVVEGDDDHLRDLVLWQSPGYLLAGGGTEAVWEPAGNEVQNVKE